MVGAKWIEATGLWTVEVEINGSIQTSTCRWLIPAIGFAAKPFIPKYKGMEMFKGELHHSAVSRPP